MTRRVLLTAVGVFAMAAGTATRGIVVPALMQMTQLRITSGCVSTLGASGPLKHKHQRRSFAGAPRLFARCLVAA